MTRFGCVIHVLVPTSRQRTCSRPAWTRAAAAASDSFVPSASRAVVLSGVVVLGLVLMVAWPLTGAPNAVRPYCDAIGTSLVAAPSAPILSANDPTVVFAVIAGGVATPLAFVSTVAVVGVVVFGPPAKVAPAPFEFGTMVKVTGTPATGSGSVSLTENAGNCPPARVSRAAGVGESVPPEKLTDSWSDAFTWSLGVKMRATTMSWPAGGFVRPVGRPTTARPAASVVAWNW